MTSLEFSAGVSPLSASFHFGGPINAGFDFNPTKSPQIEGNDHENERRMALSSSEYVIEKSLGKGVFGEVFQAAAKDGHMVALKRLSKNGIKFDWKLVQREIDVGERVKGHPGIAQLESRFETTGNVYLVFEFVEGRDLFTLMENRDFRPLMERDAKKYLRQLVNALLYCHSKKVAHRDVKLDNIIVDLAGKTKLIDFGLASMDESEDKGCSNYVGSPEYVAPEIIRRIPYSGYKADVYSLGMVLYCLVFGQFPFVPEQRFELITNKQEHPKLDWPDEDLRFPIFVSKTVKDLLSSMLEVDPDQRISMQQVADHPWLSEEKTRVTHSSEETNAS